MYKKYFIIIIFLIIVLITRFYKLGSFPRGLNQDEAGRGYNAYSFLKTGKSFRGMNFNFYLVDFSDRVPYVDFIYTYLAIPSIAVFGLNETATRLPAAILGSLTILEIYFLTLSLFHKKTFSIGAAFFLAISPWHILMSRMALDPITMTFFFFLGWLLLNKGISQNKNYLYIGSFILGLGLYTYQTALFFIPFFLLMYTVIFGKFFLKNKKSFLVMATIFFLMASPILSFYLGHKQYIVAFHEEYTLPLGLKETLLFFQKNYIAHFSLTNLKLVYQIPFIFLFYLGIVLILKKILSRFREKSNWILLLGGLIIAPLLPSSSIIYQIPSPCRSIAMVGFIEIISSLFLISFLEKIPSKLKLPTLVLILLSFIYGSLRLTSKGFPHNLNTSLGFGYGMKEVVNYVNSVQNRYDRIVVTNKINQPFIYFLFYQKYPPEKLLSEGLKRHYLSNDSYSYEAVDLFGKYTFCDFSNCFGNDPNTLYVARDWEIPGTFTNYVLVGEPPMGSFKIISYK